jgi:hypothetical protein
VDAVYGNDAAAVVGGSSFLTIEAAIAAVNSAGSSGKAIYVLPGTYNLTAGITIPNGAALRGMSTQVCTIQMLNVTADTTLITMGENCRVEDVTMKLMSVEHHTLKGIVFGGSSTVTSKLRTCVLTVDNSGASVGGTSTVTGVECSGTGTLGSGTFSFNSLKGSTLNVYSNGGGNKRGVLVSNTNIVSTRDLNVYVAKPTDTASTGSYVGIETADANNTGSIQLRATTVGTVPPTSGQSYTASDILQTNPTIITNPNYLASTGIQIGPGTDLVTKTAGEKGFSNYIHQNTLFYGLRGTYGGSANGYLWIGNGLVAGGGNKYPDVTSPPAFYRLQQSALLYGISASLNTGPGTGGTLSTLVKYTPISTGVIRDTSFNITFLAGDTSGNYYNSSVTLAAGDKLHLYVSSNGLAEAVTDLTVQLDLF